MKSVEHMARQCAGCIHFDNDSRTLEALIPGLSSLGSGDGSARGDDGYCIRHGRFTGARAVCAAFRARPGG
ncbi:MAG: hypothetical protein EPO08_17510 [Rhodospirillaceae bacterium]|nr:MAG: hypothetical protein EPO08_17510 [Rhodospirillaceae bacterium]